MNNMPLINNCKVVIIIVIQLEEQQMIDQKLFLAQLGLSEAEIDVYLVMVKGALAARDIVQVTGRSRPTVYYALTSLERRGFISKTGLEDDKRFRIEPLKRLKTVIDSKKAELDKLSNQADEFIDQFKHTAPGDHKPQISFYEGVTAVKNIIMETVYCRSKHIDSLVPTNNFFWQLGPDFVLHYVEQRKKMKVNTKNLWGTTIDPAQIVKYYDLAEIRMLPNGVGDSFESTIFMYDNSVLYISSLSSGYALLVKSGEHYRLMQTMYKNMWQSSKPLVIK